MMETWIQRSLRTGAAKRGARFIWWHHAPRRFLIPRWWRWTLVLGDAIAAMTVVARVERDGMLHGYPPRSADLERAQHLDRAPNTASTVACT